MAKIYSIVLFFFLGFFPSFVSAANFSISPSSGTFNVGDLITVKVIVSSDVPFNAVSGRLSFPTSIFSLESVSKVGSVLNFWITEPTISKSTGIVDFEGVILGGFTSKEGTIAKVNLRATKAGSGDISFLSGQVLANDGQGTNITGNLSGARYTFNAVKIKPIEPVTKPDVKIIETPEPVQPAPTLDAPEIVNSIKDGESVVLGTSHYPKAQVLLTFIADDNSKIFVTGTAKENGSFEFIVPHSLKRGIYGVTAIVVRDDGANSSVSNTIVIKVGNFLSDLGWETYAIGIILILTILYLSLVILSHPKKLFSRKIRYEVEEAKELVEKSFNNLREDIKVSEQNGNQQNSLSHLKEDLDGVEKSIIKEIKDIDV